MKKKIFLSVTARSLLFFHFLKLQHSLSLWKQKATAVGAVALVALAATEITDLY